jgi:hypothetical protein
LSKSRYGVIFLFSLLSMLCFTLMRAIFLVLSWDVIGRSLLSILNIFGVGFLYDLVFSLYTALFFCTSACSSFRIAF